MGNLLIADRGKTVVRKVNSASIIATFAGNGATYADTSATGAGPFFYRVGVQGP